MGTDPRPATFYGTAFEFLGKTRTGFSMYGMMYIECM